MSVLRHLSIVTFAIAGCGAGGVDLPAGCAELLEHCLIDQQTCVAGPACAPCPEGQFAARSGRCEAIEGDKITHNFNMFTAKPGEEILGLCQSWTLGNATELWVHGVELTQDQASHHSNWLFVPSDRYPGPDGTWDCSERKYDELTAAMAGGVLYAQSTQAEREVQRFPNSGAVRIPPYSKIISDVHILNASAKPISGHARLSLYTLPRDQVKVKLTPFHLTFRTLDIAPQAITRFTAACDLEGIYQGSLNTPVDLQIYYVLPHTHKLARRFFLEVMGGPRDGEKLVELAGFDSGARGRAYDPPRSLDGADGLRFGCEFENPTDKRLHWGFGDNEMCELLGFGESKIAFESGVSQLRPGGSDGDVRLIEGPCATVSFPYSFDKAGGPPP
ncbi:MAG: hypothetical protein EXR72_08690 [Myxococcales bacterium]|nr:hypothetical protein [Myxococcales bacterium]